MFQKKKLKCEFVLQARCQSFWKEIAKKKLNLRKKTSEEIQSKLTYFHVKKKCAFIYLQYTIIHANNQLLETTNFNVVVEKHMFKIVVHWIAYAYYIYRFEFCNLQFGNLIFYYYIIKYIYVCS